MMLTRTWEPKTRTRTRILSQGQGQGQGQGFPSFSQFNSKRKWHLFGYLPWPQIYVILYFKISVFVTAKLFFTRCGFTAIKAMCEKNLRLKPWLGVWPWNSWNSIERFCGVWRDTLHVGLYAKFHRRTCCRS